MCWMSILATYSEEGVQVVYQGCCLTHRKPRTWKPRQMRIWDRTEKRRAPEMRPEGGR